MSYENGGPDQVRTDDLLNAIEALFQLSYGPIRVCEDKKNRFSETEGKEFLGPAKGSAAAS